MLGYSLRNLSHTRFQAVCTVWGWEEYLHGAEGIVDEWPGSASDVKRNVHATERRENIREQDYAVWFEGLPGLQRNLYLHHINKQIHRSYLHPPMAARSRQ